MGVGMWDVNVVRLQTGLRDCFVSYFLVYSGSFLIVAFSEFHSACAEFWVLINIL